MHVKTTASVIALGIMAVVLGLSWFGVPPSYSEVYRVAIIMALGFCCMVYYSFEWEDEDDGR